MFIITRSMAALSALVLASVTVGASAPPPPAPTNLDVIERGRWELKSRGNPSDNRSICVTDPGVLFQLRHAKNACTRYTIENAKSSVTVHYVCTGGGTGRTSVRIETPRLIQIDTQGVAGQEPFAMQFEGRRAGACEATVTSARR